MTRSILSGLLGLISVVAIGSLPAACQSGGVGDPCIPEEEYRTNFAGFKVTEENIESRSFQCQTRICLVNHFQGRVSCPLGQQAPTPCDPKGSSCEEGESCVAGPALTASCDPKAADKGVAACKNAGGQCDAATKSCKCAKDGECCATDATGTCTSYCDGKTFECKSYVCHKPGSCQVAGADNNTGKDCCVPGTDVPITSSVCGQCADDSNRNAEKSVYCSCRCGVAEGEEEDENFNFCECPNGFTCEEIRKNVGLGDEKITGKYCIKSGSKFASDHECGTVKGTFIDNQCKGLAAPTSL